MKLHLHLYLTHIVIGIPRGVEFCNFLCTVGTFQLDPEKKARKEVDKKKGYECKPKNLEHCWSEVDNSNILHGSESGTSNHWAFITDQIESSRQCCPEAGERSIGIMLGERERLRRFGERGRKRKQRNKETKCLREMNKDKREGCNKEQQAREWGKMELN